MKLALVYPGEDFVEPPCVVAHPRECWWDARFHVAVRQVLGEQWLSFCFRSSRTEGWYEDAVAHRGVDETKLSARQKSLCGRRRCRSGLGSQLIKGGPVSRGRDGTGDTTRSWPAWTVLTGNSSSVGPLDSMLPR